MPLKINLIQDLQAQELVKARDPMKYIYAGAVLLALIPIVMYGFTFMEESSAKSAFQAKQNEWKGMEAEYQKRLEQEKTQAVVAEKQAVLDKAINAKPLRADVLNVVRKFVPDNVELLRLRLVRVNEKTVGVFLSALWNGEDAQRSIGQFYNKMKNDGFKDGEYEIIANSLTEPTIGQITNPEKIQFELSFNLLKGNK